MRDAERGLVPVGERQLHGARQRYVVFRRDFFQGADAVNPKCKIAAFGVMCGSLRRLHVEDFQHQARTVPAVFWKIIDAFFRDGWKSAAWAR